MRKFDIKESVQKGSLMVEALALLGLITMVTPILYKKSAERTTELQDINTATQMRILSKAVDDYIKDNYQEVGGEFTAGTEKLAFEDLDKLKEYLPHGFNLNESKLFNDLEIGIRKKTVLDRNNLPHNIYTSAILAPLKEKLSMMRTSKIASMIGANGGVYRQGNEETGTPSSLSGVQGAWQANYGDYFDGEETGLSDGSIVIISSEAISAAKGDASSEDVLYRVSDGDEGKNTMQTALFMGGNPIKQVSSLIANGDAADSVITIGDPVANNKGGLLVLGATNLKKALTVDTGGIDVNAGNVNIDSGTLTVGDRGESTAALYVGGATNITGNTTVGGTLGVTGATTLENTLNVTGATTLGSTLDVASNATVGGTLGVTGNTTLEGTLSVASNATVGGDLGVTGSVTVGADLTVSGTTSLGETKVTGNLTVVGGDTALENTTVDGDLTVTGETSLTSLNVADNLIANVDTVYANQDSFAIGGAVGAGGNKINVNGDSVFIGTDYQTGDAHKGLLVDANKIVLRNAVGSLKMSDTDLVVLDNNKSRIKMDGELVEIGVGDEGGEKAKIVADPSKVGFENVEGENTYSVYLDQGDLTVGSKGFVVDEYGLAIADVGGDISSEKSVNVDANGTLSSESILNSGKVAISRKGIIEVAAPTGVDDVGGFIRARRLVSDVKYPIGSEYHGFKEDGSALEKPYDYYQVNPAYTSVMNDIKLATRGGARLSDILPDYINKGIYVADNTYKQFDTAYPTVSTTGTYTEPASAENTSDLASEWLGFIPAPQCPKNYAKVVTITPFRWRMAEVFSVWPDDDFAPDEATYKDNLTHSFENYFYQERDPKQAGFVLSSNSGDSHSHEVTTGRPVTFQTNTVLNTAMEPIHVSGTSEDNQSSETLIGWHALMGFVYTPQQYEKVIKDMGITIDAEKDIFWNVFPVYAQDMAAVANVYCAFDRTDGHPWKYDNVDYYDQMYNYRFGYDKSKGYNGGDSLWSEAVNDPELGYDDAW